MKKFLAFISLTIGLSGVQLSANSTENLSKDEILKSYYHSRIEKADFFRALTASLTPLSSNPSENCEPKVSCVDTACKYSGDCHFDSDLREIITACRGSDGACVDHACKLSGDCHFDSDLLEIINLCKESNGHCVEVACRYSGDCHFDSDLEEIAIACKNSDGDCVDTACRHSGDCHFDSDLMEIIELCREQ